MMCILYIEDTPIYVLLMQRLARRLGHELFVSATLAEGDRLAHDHAGTLSLILTDLELPDGNSLSLIRTLHADLPGVPIVAVSSMQARLSSKPCSTPAVSST